MDDFLAQGGYAPYVWSSWAVAMLALIGIGIASLRHYRANRHLQERMERQGKPRRRAAAAMSPRSDRDRATASGDGASSVDPAKAEAGG